MSGNLSTINHATQTEMASYFFGTSALQVWGMASTTVPKSCQVIIENDNAPHSNLQHNDFHTHYRAERMRFTISWLVILIPRKLTYGIEYRSGTVSVLIDGGARTRWTVLLIISFDPTLRMSYTLRETSEWNTHTTHEKISSVKNQGTRNRIDWLKKKEKRVFIDAKIIRHSTHEKFTGFGILDFQPTNVILQEKLIEN